MPLISFFILQEIFLKFIHNRKSTKYIFAEVTETVKFFESVAGLADAIFFVILPGNFHLCLYYDA